MSYTSVDDVAGMFPTFERGQSDQAPTDAQIQEYIDRMGGRIDALLQRRFGESIAAAPANGNYGAWIAALPVTATDVLADINALGAALRLANVLASLGNKAAAALGRAYEAELNAEWNKLNGRDPGGKQQGTGDYDKLFDPLAATETPRPQLGGFPGAGISPDGEDADFAFKKWDTPESDIDSGTNEDAVEPSGEKGE
jgi:hypothetical protein